MRKRRTKNVLKRGIIDIYPKMPEVTIFFLDKAYHSSMIYYISRKVDFSESNNFVLCVFYSWIITKKECNKQVLDKKRELNMKICRYQSNNEKSNLLFIKTTQYK
jgi:hypothetical protein